jgi:hypothetical protein
MQSNETIATNNDVNQFLSEHGPDSTPADLSQWCKVNQRNYFQQRAMFRCLTRERKWGSPKLRALATVA